EIDFEIIEPGNFGTDALSRQFLGQMLIMVLKKRGIRRIVERDHNRFLLDPNVSLQALKEIAGQMSGIPLRERCTQSLPQLVNGGLGDQHHAQMSIANVEVERSGAVPAQRLIEFKEL